MRQSLEAPAPYSPEDQTKQTNRTIRATEDNDWNPLSVDVFDCRVCRIAEGLWDIASRNVRKNLHSRIRISMEDVEEMKRLVPVIAMKPDIQESLHRLGIDGSTNFLRHLDECSTNRLR